MLYKRPTSAAIELQLSRTILMIFLAINNIFLYLFLGLVDQTHVEVLLTVNNQINENKKSKEQEPLSTTWKTVASSSCEHHTGKVNITHALLRPNQMLVSSRISTTFLTFQVPGPFNGYVPTVDHVLIYACVFVYISS